MSKRCCENFLRAIGNDVIDAYDNTTYTICREVWSSCGYEDTIYMTITHCPFCGVKL
jgi:hypothetical protein